MRKKKEMLNIKEAHVKEAVCPNGKSMRLRPNEAHTNEHNEETPAKKNQRRLHTGIVNRRQGRQRTPSPFPSTASKQLRKFTESPARLLNCPTPLAKLDSPSVSWVSSPVASSLPQSERRTCWCVIVLLRLVVAIDALGCY